MILDILPESAMESIRILILSGLRFCFLDLIRVFRRLLWRMKEVRGISEFLLGISRKLGGV